MVSLLKNVCNELDFIRLPKKRSSLLSIKNEFIRKVYIDFFMFSKNCGKLIFKKKT